MIYTKVHPGDRVRVTPRRGIEDGAPTVEGRVTEVTPTYVTIRGLGFTQFQSKFFDIEVLETTREILPVQPGFYRATGNSSALEATVYRAEDGDWWWISDCYGFGPARISDADVIERHAPLVPLVPASSSAVPGGE